MTVEQKIKQKRRDYLGIRNITWTFKHESDSVASIISFNGNNIIISSALQHLGHIVEIHSHGEVPITAIMLKAFGSEEESDERHVAGIHGLKGEATGGAVEVGIVDELLDGLQDLLEEGALNETKLEHGGR